ncbi:hypothetical protein BBR01nite_62560 [Brevibacillus brevis]|nr:hypothetical protein BBR01nite_62560 [Brevibacillus brevis]
MTSEEAKKEAQAFDNLLTQRATEIAADTGVDLSKYAQLKKPTFGKWTKTYSKRLKS